MVLGVTPPGEHEVLVFLVQIAVLVGLARALGALARRIGQPAVVGELLAGIVAGPSLFGRIAPDAFDWTFPSSESQGAMLFALAWLGLLLLLTVTGMESDLSVIRQLGRPVVTVTAGSLLVPLAGGFALGSVAPAVLVGSDTGPGVFAAFLAVAMSISSLPVVARVLTELGIVRRNVGQLVLAVAVTNDIVGWLLLGVVVGVASGEGEVSPGSVMLTVAAIAAFAVGALTLGGFLVDRGLRRIAGHGVESQVGAVIVVVATAGAITQAIGVEAVIGAFVAGVVLGRSRWRDDRAMAMLATLTNAVLAPLFFATAGLRIDLGVFTDRTVAVWSIVIIAVASSTKVIGATVSARMVGVPWPEARALGAGLNARGALEIVIASIGLSLGILTDASYAAIVVMALATSIAAPPLLRWSLRDWAGTPAEQERLADEDAARRRVILSARPPLLLTRGRPGSITTAQFVHVCWPPHHPVEIATTASDREIEPVLFTFADRQVHVRSFRDTGRLLDEVRRGYSAVAVGVNDRPGEPLLGELHETLLRAARIPVVLVRRERISGHPLPPAFAHAIVPVTESHTSRAALELGAGMSASLGTKLTLVHVAPAAPIVMGAMPAATLRTADPVLRAAAGSARLAGARDLATIARTADDAAAEINRLALELEADIIIVGTTITNGHLGRNAAYILEHSPTSVAAVATPPGWTGPHHDAAEHGP